MRAALALPALPGCVLYDAEPPPPDATPMPRVILHGVIEMTSQTIFEPGPSCPTPPPGPLRFAIVEGEGGKTITSESGEVLSDIRVLDDWNPADVSFTMAADWGNGFTPTIHYYFEAFFGGLVDGGGNFDHAGCEAFLSLEGHWGDV